MKGKKFLAFASIFAGVALVGSTFAAWAVTDNADPFGIKVSPGTISSDTTTNYVTLSYGERSYANVGNIKSNTKRLAASVELKAEWELNPKDALSSTLEGQFTVEMAQATKSGVKLSDLLKIYVYDAAPTLSEGTLVSTLNGNKIGEVDGTAQKTSDSVTITLNHDSDKKGNSKTVYVVVEYIDTTSENIEAVASDEVTLTLDWKKTNNIVTGHTIYYSGSLTDVCLYAWKTDKSTNGPLPGVAMTKVRDGLYSYVLDSSYIGFLFFRDNNEMTKLTQDDIMVADWVKDYEDKELICFDGSDWIEVPTEVNTLTKDYYLVGTFNNWKSSDTGNYGFTATATEGKYSLTGVTLAAGDEFKVVSKDGSNWYTDASIWEAISTWVELNGTNMKVKTGQGGTYSFEFYVTSEQSNHIVPTKTA